MSRPESEKTVGAAAREKGREQIQKTTGKRRERAPGRK
jgi:hypothetical protein